MNQHLGGCNPKIQHVPKHVLQQQRIGGRRGEFAGGHRQVAKPVGLNACVITLVEGGRWVRDGCCATCDNDAALQGGRNGYCPNGLGGVKGHHVRVDAYGQRMLRKRVQACCKVCSASSTLWALLLFFEKMS